MSEKSKARVRKPPKPKRLSTQLSAEGLFEITIKLRARTITVSEASALQAAVRGDLISKLIDDDQDAELLGATTVATNLLLSFWVPLYACSTGDVPTKSEFLKMAETDMSFWIETARELNPTWFEWLDEILDPTPEEQKEQEKKD